VQAHQPPVFIFKSTDAMSNFSIVKTTSLLLIISMGHSAGWGQAAPLTAVSPDVVYTVQAEGQHAVIRVLTRAASCPALHWNGKLTKTMTPRAIPANIPIRGDSAQSDTKEAAFDVLTCEATWPSDAKQVKVAGQTVPAPQSQIKRIVIIADTGCRMKGSENAFQPCNDPLKWPFAQVAQSAAALKPDLVIHIGDIHYRESPCPEGNSGCANAPWGYGYDAWKADFFNPAAPLLAAAPWVFVRGNHESCARAGQGWFRFLDTQPWRQKRSCNDPANDSDADYSAPYAVPIDANSQVIVYDSSRTSGKPFLTTDLSFSKYTAQLKVVDQLSKQKANSFFLSHHPLLAVIASKSEKKFKFAGNEGLQSVFSASYPERLFPDGVSVAMHGHVHLFEAISFKSKHPVSLVMGNAGSANEGGVPASLPQGTELVKGAEIEDYIGRADFGFATLDRADSKINGDWILTEYTPSGQPVIKCTISGSKSRCAHLMASTPTAH
jgi:hypothetical protein